LDIPGALEVSVNGVSFGGFEGLNSFMWTKLSATADDYGTFGWIDWSAE